MNPAPPPRGEQEEPWWVIARSVLPPLLILVLLSPVLVPLAAVWLLAVMFEDSVMRLAFRVTTWYLWPRWGKCVLLVT